MTIHRTYFYDSVRYYLAGGSLTQSQVDGFTVFLDWYDNENPPLPQKYHIDDRCLAYILATTWHETAATMQPIAEYGKGQGHSYGVPDPETGQAYYGRGYVQLTHKENYQRQDEKLGLQGALIANADLALDPEIAKKIIIFGMYDADFTGACLGEFFTDELTDWYEARTIVNGHDRASDIAAYAEKLHNAIGHT